MLEGVMPKDMANERLLNSHSNGQTRKLKIPVMSISGDSDEEWLS
jgi:hypothetical protein